jgi:hypothetical protein
VACPSKHGSDAADHRLEQVKTRVRDDVVRQIYWEHQEHDVKGRMIARYHSFPELHENGR